jgi:hypothetical protein
MERSPQEQATVFSRKNKTALVSSCRSPLLVSRKRNISEKLARRIVGISLRNFSRMLLLAPAPFLLFSMNRIGQRRSFSFHRRINELSFFASRWCNHIAHRGFSQLYTIICFLSMIDGGNFLIDWEKGILIVYPFFVAYASLLFQYRYLSELSAQV